LFALKLAFRVGTGRFDAVPLALHWGTLDFTDGTLIVVGTKCFTCWTLIRFTLIWWTTDGTLWWWIAICTIPYTNGGGTIWRTDSRTYRVIAHPCTFRMTGKNEREKKNGEDGLHFVYVYLWEREVSYTALLFSRG